MPRSALRIEAFDNAPAGLGRPGMGTLDLTEGLGLGVIGFVLGGALGFALGATAVASVTRRY